MSSFRCYHCFRTHSVDAELCPFTGRSIPSGWRTGSPLRGWLGWRRLGAALLAAALLVTLPWPHRVAAGPAPLSAVGHALTAGVGPRIDVVFCIDSTGSMSDEIDVVKTRVVKMMDDIRGGNPRPRVRFGVVTYRDKGDVYLTRTHPLTEDIQATQQFVNTLVADGGGDTPESVNEALRVSVNEMQWDGQASKMLFLIGDAGPHMDYQDQPDYHLTCKEAHRKGIRIDAIGCSGITECGLDDFRQIASIGGGEFAFLTYHKQVAGADGRMRHEVYEGDRRYVTEEGGDKWRGGAKDLPAAARASSAPAMPAPSGGAALENNLDTVLTERVKTEARKAGVAY